LIEIFKNTPPKGKFILMKRYQKVQFKKKYSIKLLDEFFNKFPEEKRGRLKFKEKEIQNTKLLIYDKIIHKALKIEAHCIGCLKENVLKDTVIITVSFFKING
tara:strand:+ start:3381 stop:3689 length:309 start_codon:yes stop_codon:yes gene_type:complete